MVFFPYTVLSSDFEMILSCTGHDVPLAAVNPLRTHLFFLSLHLTQSKLTNTRLMSDVHHRCVLGVSEHFDLS